MGAILTIVCLSLNMLGAAGAASYNQLPQAIWSQKPNAEYLPVREDIYTVPNTSTLYLHMGEEKASQTKVWSPDVLRAVDAVTGKTKWSFSFAKPGYGWPSTEDPFIYLPDGSVYAYFASEQLLYAISSSGKEIWSKRLAADTPYNGKLYRLADGTLVIAGATSSAAGKESVKVVGLDAKGNLKFSRVLSGSLVAVTKERIVVKAPTTTGAATKVIGYDSSLKPFYEYAFAKGAYVNDYTAFALSDGTMIFSVSQADNKLKQSIMALSASGKLISNRSFDRNGLAFSAGNGYLFMNYATKKISYYTLKGLVKERALSDFVLPEGDILPMARTAASGKLLVDLVSRQYIMDPATLNVLHDFGPGIKGTILEYSNNRIIVHAWQEDKIACYPLK